MNICILGWYGTETLGDRAILDGIIKIMNNERNVSNIYLGSLYPFFTERTLYEDAHILQDCFLGKIIVFPENDTHELKNAIKCCDLVIMGGGPLSDSKELYLIKAAFKYAESKRRKRIVFGCGYGPFNNTAMHRVAKEIVMLSNLCIFRDEISKNRARNDVPEKKMYHLADPAIVSILYYANQCADNMVRDEITVNYRSFYDGITKNIHLKKGLNKLLVDVAQAFNKVKLVPMHTYFHGGDDRRFFSDMLSIGDYTPKNIEVQYKPQNLYQLYDTFRSSFGCIGMRYHSIVIQTILNGNNIILDYTSPHQGKIHGFINDLIGSEFYNDRYYNVVEGDIDNDLCISSLKENKHFHYLNQLNSILEQYQVVLKELKDD